MSKHDKALEYFRQGYNCSQAVFLPFAGENPTNTRIASGFGGGMARMQKTCGAVTGGILVLGLWHGAPGCPTEESKQKLYSMIRDFNDQFIKVLGSDQCIDLLGVDMNSEEGKKIIKERALHTSICEKCIMAAVTLLEK